MLVAQTKADIIHSKLRIVQNCPLAAHPLAPTIYGVNVDPNAAHTRQTRTLIQMKGIPQERNPTRRILRVSQSRIWKLG